MAKQRFAISAASFCLHFLVFSKALVVRAQREFNLEDVSPSSVPSSTDVEYVCTLRDLWTAGRHPVQYPSNRRPHWSAPIAVFHTGEYVMWASGGMASSGMEQLAENGNARAVQAEIQSFSPASAVGTAVVGRSLFDDELELAPVAATASRHYLSIASMIAPSPDWFSGVSSFDALSSVTGNWYASFAIESYPWDAGTEEGLQYSLFNNDQDPAQPITQITRRTAPSNVNRIFLNPFRTSVWPVARWECRLNLDPVPCDLDCQWLRFLNRIFGTPV